MIGMALTLVLGITACVEHAGPDAELCAVPAISVEVSLTSDAMDPAAISVCRHQEVTLVIESDIEGVIHIHGYDDQIPATQLDSDGETRLAFNADRSGQFPVELHRQEDPQGVEVGVFTVHEP
jgi:hypothetical protein